VRARSEPTATESARRPIVASHAGITPKTRPRTWRRDFPPVLRCLPVPTSGSQHLGA